MKRSIHLLLLLGGLFGGIHSLSAQAFFNYQTIGVHTCYVSLSWDGQTPSVGVGYNFRNTNQFGFTDFVAELRSPLTDLYDLKHQELIVGANGPFRLRNRRFLVGGIHARLKTYVAEDAPHTRLTLATSLLPSYSFSGVLSDKPYPTISARATYLLVLLDKAQGETAPVWLPGHGTEVGANFSLHLERSLGISLNSFISQHWHFKADGNVFQPEETKLHTGGDFNLGAAYFLERW